jgi:uncharacterized protein
LISHKNGTILHNLVSGGMVLLNKQNIQKYYTLESNDFSDVDFVQKMQDLGFVVEKKDERIAMRKQYEKVTNSKRNKGLFVVVTDRCNLGCHYCYEEKDQWILMDKPTQEQVKSFAKNLVTETPTEYFGIQWFGGEPTMNVSAIKNLSLYFSELCEEIGADYYQQMTTNGTTFSPQMADLLVNELGIKKYQITVDGFKEDHDKSRPYLASMDPEEMSAIQIAQRKKLQPSFSLPIMGQAAPAPKQKSSYDVIMKNIELLLSLGAQISLRMNVNSNTLPRVCLLLDELYEKEYFTENEKGGILYAYASPIFDGCEGSYNTMSKEKFSKGMGKIRNWYLDRNLPYESQNLLQFTGNTCTANKRYEYVVNADGSLCKCTHKIGMEEYTIGHVGDAEKLPDYKESQSAFNQFDPFEDKECYSCEVLPICMGGCKASNKVGENVDYEPGCTTARFGLRQEILDLYESKRR